MGRPRSVSCKAEDRGHTSECWIWQGSVSEDGYAMCGRIVRGVLHGFAHRWSYAEHVGDIPEGMQVDHVCAQRACINPDHLEPVTPSENVRRSWARITRIQTRDEKGRFCTA